MEERKRVPAALRDHSKAHVPEIVKLPDAIGLGPRGTHAKGEDWESESSASSVSSYSSAEEQNVRRRSKRSESKVSRRSSKRSSCVSIVSAGAGTSPGKSRQVSTHSGAISVVSKTSRQSAVTFGLPGHPESEDDGSVSSSSSSGPEMPPGLNPQIITETRPPGAARMLRIATEKGATNGLRGGIPAVCT